MAVVEKVKRKATEVKSKASNLISGKKVKQWEGIESILDLEYELKKLNPKVNISLTGKGRSQNLQIDCLPEDLKMPDGFYYDFKNGITNKGNSSVGMTMSAGVCLEPLEWDLNTTDHRRIYYEMKRLNPNVEIKMQAQSYFGYVTYSRENFRRHQLVSNTDCQLVLPEGVNIEDLNMPEGFYYNTKNGLTNKHNTRGIYTGMDVVNDTSENIANNEVKSKASNVINETKAKASNLINETKAKASNLISGRKAKASNLISGKKVKQLEGIETILDLEYELKKLNPKVNISLTGKGRSQNLQIDCLPEDLKMPEGFYYDFKNGITNKGNSSVSMTMSAGVCLEPLEWDLNTTDHRRIYYEMKRLNPNVEIKMQAQSYFGNVTYSRENFRRHQLVSNTDCQLVLPEGVDIEGLNMPEGFYYNTKNGLTNKHNTRGIYTGMDVVNDTPENIANNVVEYERSNSL